MILHRRIRGADLSNRTARVQKWVRSRGGASGFRERSRYLDEVDQADDPQERRPERRGHPPSPPRRGRLRRRRHGHRSEAKWIPPRPKKPPRDLAAWMDQERTGVRGCRSRGGGSALPCYACRARHGEGGVGRGWRSGAEQRCPSSSREDGGKARGSGSWPLTVTSLC